MGPSSHMLRCQTVRYVSLVLYTLSTLLADFVLVLSGTSKGALVGPHRTPQTSLLPGSILSVSNGSQILPWNRCHLSLYY